MNAHFVLRVATDRDWAADVRAQSFWLEETNRLEELCIHIQISFSAPASPYFCSLKLDIGNLK